MTKRDASMFISGTRDGIVWRVLWQGQTYLYRTGDYVENEELRAQGRFHEIARRRRFTNRLPRFDTRALARSAIMDGSLKPLPPGAPTSWDE